MSVWSLSYAECANTGTYLPVYTDRNELYRRVCAKERTTKHQVVALNQVLEEDHPDVVFHYGLTSEDLSHNSRWTQVDLVISKVSHLLRDLVQHVAVLAESVHTPVLAHTHGQAATPVMLGAYLKAKLKHLPIVRPQFRLGGSNGQLTALRYATGLNDFNNLANNWLKRVKHHVRGLESTHIIVPTEDCGLLQVGPSNDATLLTAISVCLKTRALARALWDHCYRGILTSASSSGQAGSSAMPHKVNPIELENAEGCFSNAYHTFINALEANSDSRGLRDLSNSVVNRQMQEGWCYLFLGLNSLITGVSKSVYRKDLIIKELKANPGCLSELLRYYMQAVEGRADPYWDLKDNPPTDFDETIKRMSEWTII